MLSLIEIEKSNISFDAVDILSNGLASVDIWPALSLTYDENKNITGKRKKDNATLCRMTEKAERSTIVRPVGKHTIDSRSALLTNRLCTLILQINPTVVVVKRTRQALTQSKNPSLEHIFLCCFLIQIETIRYEHQFGQYFQYFIRIQLVIQHSSISNTSTSNRIERKLHIVGVARKTAKIIW